MPQRKPTNFAKNIPTAFWAILLLALVAGLILSFTANEVEKAVNEHSSEEREFLKIYKNSVRQTSQNIRQNLKAKISGTWMAEQGTSQLIVDFTKKGQFVMRIVDTESPFYILAAHGLYTAYPTNEEQNVQEGYYPLLLSERRDTRLPLIRPTTYTKFRNLNVQDSIFDWSMTEGNLILSPRETPENLEALLNAMADSDGNVTFARPR